MAGSKPPQCLRPLIREMKSSGWDWMRLNGGHVRFYHPATSATVTASSTSRDFNQFKILRRQMQRALETVG
jgi:predicted RNA binding protein YcfA (HicA-like mRNA interferase family)